MHSRFIGPNSNWRLTEYNAVQAKEETGKTYNEESRIRRLWLRYLTETSAFLERVGRVMRLYATAGDEKLESALGLNKELSDGSNGGGTVVESLGRWLSRVTSS